MAEQDTEVVLEQDKPTPASDSGDGKEIDVTATAATAGDAEDDDAIDDLEFLIDDIEDQIAPLGL